MKNIYFRFRFIALFLSFLTFLPFPCKVDAGTGTGIGNCHSYVYWKLTGSDEFRIEPKELIKELERRMYKEVNIGNNVIDDRIPFSLTPGDVITFGMGHSHSAIVINPNSFHHVRPTNNYKVHKKYRNLERDGDLYQINKNRLSYYPKEYKDSLKKKGATDSAIKKKTFGFYRENDRFEDFYAIIPQAQDEQVTIWKQPDSLNITPKENTVPKGQEAHFEAQFWYSHISDPVDVSAMTTINWAPTFVRNGKIDTASLDPQSKPYKIEVSILVSRPSGLKGPKFHPYKATAGLIVLPEQKPPDYLRDSNMMVPPVTGAIDDFSETEYEDLNPEDIRLLFVEPSTKTTKIGEPVQCRAILWFKNGKEVDVTDQASWTGAPSGIFTPTGRGTFTIKATYGKFAGSERINVQEETWSVYEGQKPISSAGDVNANVPIAGPTDYEWYVLCDKMSGDVVYSKHTDLTQHFIMAGPLPGPRTAEGWIMDYCPRGRCTRDGVCANEPAKGGKWNVICNTESGDITFANHRPGSLKYQVMAGNFRGEPEARLWQQENCPLGRCDYNGQCVESPADVKSGQGDWYITCNLPSGFIEISKSPFNFSSYRAMEGPFLGEPDARLQINRKYPSWRCDSQGRYLPKAIETKTKNNEFALPGDSDTLKSIADSEAGKSEGQKVVEGVRAFMKTIDEEQRIRQQQADAFTQEAMSRNFESFLQIITSNPQYFNSKRPKDRQSKYDLNTPGPVWNPVDGWGGAKAGGVDIYCPGNSEVRRRKCAEAGQFLRSIGGTRWEQDIQRTELFQAQCCGSNGPNEVNSGGSDTTSNTTTEEPTRSTKSYDECLAIICSACGQGISLAGEEYDNPECNRCRKARAKEIKACMEGK